MFNNKNLEKIESKKSDVVVRENDEGYNVEIHVISGQCINDVVANTYGRKLGNYKIPNDNSNIEIIDDLIRKIADDKSIINGLRRAPGDSYEIIIEVDDSIDKTTACYKGTNNVQFELSPSSTYIEKVDDFLNNLYNDIK